jgi:hypothetical protein
LVSLLVDGDKYQMKLNVDGDKYQMKLNINGVVSNK